jgi:trans-aconitate methyltransferase
MAEQRDESNRWDAADYDDDHGFVAEYGQGLLDLLDPQPDERVLDLGCGTGHLTADVADRGAEAVGVDRSAEMVAAARDAFGDRSDLSFQRADARSVAVDDRFHGVLSNAALHWIPDDDQDGVLETVRDALVTGGRFVAEMGGTGNVAAIVSATLAELRARGYDRVHPWYFPTVGEYATRLERHGFEVRRAVLFDRPTELDDGEAGLRNWLEMFGDSLFAALSEGEQAEVVTAIEDRLRDELFDGDEAVWVADYRRLRFVAVRAD